MTDRKKVVLVVDDDPNIREYLATILDDAGFVPEVVENGRMAVEAIDSGTHDAIVLDYMMPEMNGLDVLNYLMEKGSRTPCIIITGKGSEELAVKMLKEGAFDYLTKPFREEKLIAVLKNAIEVTRLGTESFSDAKQELLWLRQENSFLREQVSFIRKVITMNRKGDRVIEGFSKKLIELDVSNLPRNRFLLQRELDRLKKLSKGKLDDSAFQDDSSNPDEH